MKIYLAGGVQGNLRPAWRYVAKAENPSLDKLIGGLQHENFWRGGESRHWLHGASPVKENEDISGGQYNLSGLRRSDIIRRGGSSDIKNDETISGITPYADTFQMGEKCSYSWQGSPRGGRGGYDPIIRQHKPYILESFYYVDEDTERLLPLFGDFMLDSGAFTFCGQDGFDNMKFEEYLESYADFINRNHIEKFFELDIDSIIGYEKVCKLRKKLERLTNKQSIPVWHISRGKEEFIRHCKEYPYVALGGYVAGIKANDPRQKLYIKSYPWFIQTAHKYDAKIHGLGFTNLKGLERFHFDSVDSTAWTTGNRFGYIYKFDGRTMQKIKKPAGMRLKDSRKVALINYTEWIKFQKYAEYNL